MSPITEINDYAEVSIEGFPVNGNAVLKVEQSPSFSATYEYDPDTDSQRENQFKSLGFMSPQPPSGYGVVHEMVADFSIKGKSFGLDTKDFSLLQLEHKTSRIILGTTKVYNDFDFKFGLIGVQADWDEAIFESAYVTFPAMSETDGFSRIAQEIVSDSLEEAQIARKSQWPAIAVNDEVMLELIVGTYGSKSFRKKKIYSLESSVGFSITAIDSLISAKTIWERYIVPLSKLMSISSGVAISPGSVALRIKGLPYSSVNMVSSEITDKFESDHRTYFDLSQFRGNDYKKWIEGFSKIDYFASLLIRSFSGPYDFLLLAGILSQLDHLYDKLSEDNPPLGRFRERVASLIEKWERSGFIFRFGIKDTVPERVRLMRNLLVHDTILHDPLTHNDSSIDSRMLEAGAIFSLARLLHLSTMMQFLGIEWEYMVKWDGFPDGFLTRYAVESFYRGIEKWEELPDFGKNPPTILSV